MFRAMESVRSRLQQIGAVIRPHAIVSIRIAKVIKKLLHNVGVELVPTTSYLVASLWKDNYEFTGLLHHTTGYTLIDDERLYILYQFMKAAGSLKGEVAELGVYKGGSAKLLAQTIVRNNFNKTLYLFDTFSGIPRTNPQKDIHKEGDFSDTSLIAVQRYLSDCKDIVYHQGLFQDTLNRVSSVGFSLIHIDCDIYESVNQCTEFFYPRLTSGGYMIFDDYGFRSCPGVKHAVDEFFTNKAEYPIYLPTGQCLVIKR